MFLKKFVIVVVLFSAAAFAQTQNALAQKLAPPPKELVNALKALGPGLGVAVRRLSQEPPAGNVMADNQWLLAINGDTPLNPASTMKLPSTFAALSLLRPDYRYQTSVHLRGRLQDGVLDGDLIWRGSGDPKFVIEDMQAFALQLRNAGLREIRGNLILDDALFDVDSSLASIDGDLSQPYNVAPFAAMMNFKSTKFVATPQEGARSVIISLDPALADTQLHSSVRAMDGRCAYGASGLAIVDFTPANAFNQPAKIGVSGNYSMSCGEQGSYSAVLDHRAFAHGFFKAAWQAAGGVFSGVTKIERGAVKTLPVFATWVSPRTVGDLVKDANKFSNNVVTRHLLLTATAATFRLPATIERAQSMMGSFLKTKAIDFPGIVVENGSGLSRKERISAKHLVMVLDSAARSDVSQEFIQSLPIIGVDGTMKNRLKQEAIVGNAYIKTGSLRDVRAIAGYVKAQSGQWYLLSYIANGASMQNAERLQNALLMWLFNDG